MLLNNHKLWEFYQCLEEDLKSHVGLIFIYLAKYEVDTLFIHALAVVKSRCVEFAGIRHHWFAIILNYGCVYHEFVEFGGLEVLGVEAVAIGSIINKDLLQLFLDGFQVIENFRRSCWHIYRLLGLCLKLLLAVPLSGNVLLFVALRITRLASPFDTHDTLSWTNRSFHLLFSRRFLPLLYHLIHVNAVDVALNFLLLSWALVPRVGLPVKLIILRDLKSLGIHLHHFVDDLVLTLGVICRCSLFWRLSRDHMQWRGPPITRPWFSSFSVSLLLTVCHAHLIWKTITDRGLPLTHVIVRIIAILWTLTLRI